MNARPYRMNARPNRMNARPTASMPGMNPCTALWNPFRHPMEVMGARGVVMAKGEVQWPRSVRHDTARHHRRPSGVRRTNPVNTVDPQGALFDPSQAVIPRPAEGYNFQGRNINSACSAFGPEEEIGHTHPVAD